MNGATLVVLVIVLAAAAFAVRSMVRHGAPGCDEKGPCSSCPLSENCLSKKGKKVTR